MKIIVTNEIFHQWLLDRCSFSYYACEALYEYLVKLEEELNIDMEIDTDFISKQYIEQQIDIALVDNQVNDLYQLSKITKVIWNDNETVLYQRKQY